MNANGTPSGLVPAKAGNLRALKRYAHLFNRQRKAGAVRAALTGGQSMIMCDVPWYNDPEDAKGHPWRASALVFCVLFVFWSVIAYFVWTNRSLVTSLLVGAGFGAVGVVGVWRGMRKLGGRREGEQRAVAGSRFGVDVIAMGAGVGIVTFGATSGSAGIVGSGALVFALGLAWYLIKRSVSRR